MISLGVQPEQKNNRFGAKNRPKKSDTGKRGDDFEKKRKWPKMKKLEQEGDGASGSGNYQTPLSQRSSIIIAGGGKE